MQYSNELKVGAAIVLAVIAAILGIRFMQDIPLFGDTYLMHAQFQEAGGLTSGNPVRMKGVNVGSVESVRLDQEAQRVRARLRIEGDIDIPEGSHAQVSGFSGLGGVHISITPGPTENPPLSPGATLSPPPEGTVLDRLTDQAPALASKADSLLTNANVTMAELGRQFGNPNSDVRETLASIRAFANDLESLTEAEDENIRALIQNLRTVSGDLEDFTSQHGDSLGVVVTRLNRSLNRLNRSLALFEHTTATLDTVAIKINQGQGTVGRLVNDPSLYNRLDSAAVQTNRLLEDIRRNPGRYLDDMTLMKVF